MKSLIFKKHFVSDQRKENLCSNDGLKNIINCKCCRAKSWIQIYISKANWGKDGDSDNAGDLAPSNLHFSVSSRPTQDPECGRMAWELGAWAVWEYTSGQWIWWYRFLGNSLYWLHFVTFWMFILTLNFAFMFYSRHYLCHDASTR